jgi:hypothetical protein
MIRRPFAIAFCALAAACGDAGKPAAPPPAAAAPPAPYDAVAEAAGSYQVRAAFAPASVARGAKATLAIEIVMTRADVHVQQEFPLKVTLAPSPGVGIPKPTLVHADAVDPAAKGRRWDVTARAGAAGRQQVEATLRFAICKETAPEWCVTRNETVTAALDVR